MRPGEFLWAMMKEKERRQTQKNAHQLPALRLSQLTRFQKNVNLAFGFKAKRHLASKQPL